MSWGILLLAAMVTMLLAFALRIPVAIALTLAGFVGLVLAADLTLAESALRQITYGANYNFLLVAVPLFIFMAEIFTATGMSSRAFGAVKTLFGRRAAAVPLSTIGLGALLAAVSGSSAANVASLGRVAMEEMIAQGYRRPLAAGVVAVSGSLGIIIPPSIPAILYGFVNEMSVLAIFTAGVIPGLLIAAFSMLVTVIWVSYVARKTEVSVPVGRESVDQANGDGQWSQPPHMETVVDSASDEDSIRPEDRDMEPSSRLAAGLQLLPILALVSLVLGIIYAGVATPTEAAAIGCAGAVLVAGTGGGLSWKSMQVAIDRSLRSSGFILLIIMGAVYFVFFLNYAQIPNSAVNLVVEAEIGPAATLAIVIVVMLALGTLMETISLVLVATPILAPVLVAAGFEPLAVAIILLILIEMGLNTPPVGLNIFIMLGVGKPYNLSYGDIVKGCLVYLLPGFMTIGVILMVPAITTLGTG
jgi:C4-dicarboxylate transporter DctM subunit